MAKTFERVNPVIEPEYYTEGSLKQGEEKVLLLFRKHIKTYDRLSSLCSFLMIAFFLASLLLIVLGAGSSIKVNSPGYQSSYVTVPASSGVVLNIMVYLGIGCILFGITFLVLFLVFKAAKDKAMWEQYEWEYFKANFIDPMANRRTQQQQNRPQGASSHEDKQK